ncbi:MAG: hypothetical protein EOP11_00855 [Proteobacteria bacterium]|nr:MAG: hypothetical protein EOP11_00855 [Pseudomonadota bacterium]
MAPTSKPQLNEAMPSPAPIDLSKRAHELLAGFSAQGGGNPARFAILVKEDAAFISAALSAAPPAPGDGEPYSRHIIFAGPEGEAMIAHWPAGSLSWPHDHGEAWGTVIVLEGHVIEQGFRLKSDLEEAGSEHAYQTGDAIQVRPGGIHSMRAIPRSITLHLYSPPIREMKVYDQPTRIIYTVADNCGAWIPANRELIKGRETFDHHPLHHEIS